MATERFLEHLREHEPRFLCSAAGRSAGERIEIPVHHVLRLPASDNALKVLRRFLGDRAVPVEALYAAHDGFELYVQSRARVGLRLLPIAGWARATKRFRNEMEDWGRSLEEAFDFEREGVVFAEPPASGNRLILHDGAVHYADHDGGDEAPLASSFDEFLDELVDDPARFLYELGCYARYSDGRTRTQWIPERYLSSERGGGQGDQQG